MESPSTGRPPPLQNESAPLETVAAVGLGETMALLRQDPSESLQPQFSAGFGGAESNVMTQLSRLGHATRWLSSLGDDTFGARITQGLENEGVQVFCAPNHGKNTGLMIKTYEGKENPNVTYYRKDSAASHLNLNNVPPELITTARLIHVTGIYPALSTTSLETTLRVLGIAQQASVLISFDVNYRPALWSRSQAREVLPLIARYATIIFGSRDELELLVEDSAEKNDLELLEVLAGNGCDVVLKRGSHGAMALTDSRVFESPAWPVHVVDTVGAGDAFVGGYLSQYLEGAPTPRCLAVATYCGAMTCEDLGDWEGQARLSDLVCKGILPPASNKGKELP